MPESEQRHTGHGSDATSNETQFPPIDHDMHSAHEGHNMAEHSMHDVQMDHVDHKERAQHADHTGHEQMFRSRFRGSL